VTIGATLAVAAALGLQSVVGDYYKGDGLGLIVNLSLTADGSFSFWRGGHLGQVAAIEGHARLEGSSLYLEPPATLPHDDVEYLPRKLVVVYWADRVYLVPEVEGPKFVAYVTRKREPRDAIHGWFLLRQSDWQKAATGLPEMPPEWQKWLLRAPVDARIIRALTRHRAEINAGGNKGLHPGQLLSLVSKQYGPSDVRVVSVTAESSTIENDYGDPPLLVGWRVTSRGP
jgi:hypothetical protein